MRCLFRCCGDWSRSWKCCRRRCSGTGCAAFAVDDRILTEPGWDGDLVRVTGHCGATLVVLSDDARTMERSVGGLPLPLDGGRVGAGPFRCGRHARGAGDGVAQR